MRIDAVAVDVIDTQEPTVFRVRHDQTPAIVLNAGVTRGHVVGHGAQLASAGQRQVDLLAGAQIASEQQPTVGFAVRVLQHLALAAPAGTLVHDRGNVIVRRDDLDRGGVGGDPAFLGANRQQHAVHALLRARAGIQVESKDLMHVGQAMVDDHLFPIAVRVAKRGRRRR